MPIDMSFFFAEEWPRYEYTKRPIEKVAVQFVHDARTAPPIDYIKRKLADGLADHIFKNNYANLERETLHAYAYDRREVHYRMSVYVCLPEVK
jgi:hypothetical protein